MRLSRKLGTYLATFLKSIVSGDSFDKQQWLRQEFQLKNDQRDEYLENLKFILGSYF